MESTAGHSDTGDVYVGAGAFRYRVDPSWNIPANTSLGEVVGVACDADDRVYLFSRGVPNVLHYERDVRPLACWGEDQFARPHGICVGPDGNVYCTDDFGHAVYVFTSDGRLRQTLGSPRQPSATGATSIDYRTIRQSAGPFSYPTNVAIAPSGDLYIADGYGNARIHLFAPDGRLLHSWGEPGSGPGQFHVPHGIAVDADGIVYVADRENSRIQRFNAYGAFIDEWTDIARPCEVFIDRAGSVYVAELGFHAGRWPGTGEAEHGAVGGRVSIFDRNGVVLARWGGGANPCAPGDFFAPHDIWVDSRGDIYVAEVTLSGGGRAGRVPLSCHTLQKFVKD
jgi:DNA-binding beta-propeller fold protein YncE